MSWFVMLFVGICFAFANKPIKAIYYEPASIGENPLNGRIDYYTNIYSDFHRQFIQLIYNLGATHVIVGPIWYLCDDCHNNFLEELVNKNLSLINTLQGSGDRHEIQVIYNDVQKIMKENSKHKNVFCGFYVPALDASTPRESWDNYYQFFIERLCVNPITCFVEFPINYSQGRIDVINDYDFKQINFDGQWVINVYDANSYSFFLDLYIQKFQNVLIPKWLPFVYTSNYGNEFSQLRDLTAITKLIQNDATAQGLAIAEFSDSWWRSSQADVSNNLTLCPNWNSYSHSDCGYSYNYVHNGSETIQSILYIEWLGIFNVSSHPLQLCLTPKKIASYIANIWHGNETNLIFTCATIDIFFWISAIIDYQISKEYFFWFPAVLFTSPFVLFYFITILVYCFAPCCYSSA